MAKQEEIVEAKTAIKKTGRGGKYNFPSTIPPEDPEDVRQVLSECLHWYEVGNKRAVTDDEIEERTIEFFKHCVDIGERPTVEKYALALGYVRTTINEWERGNNASPRRMDIIKKAKEVLASYDAGMVSNGKLNPVPYIFRAKNYYGMKDNQDITITPNNPITDVNPADIVQKYEELPD
jgi:hypothetical protein